MTQDAWKDAWEAETPQRRGKNYHGSPQTARKWKFANDQRYEHVTINRMRTGHINTGSYLYNIGKRPTPECQCGYEKQSIEHVMTRCPLLNATRKEAIKSTKSKQISMQWLLYDQEGTKWAIKLWKKMGEIRKRTEEVENEEEKEKEKELEWGWGQIEK